MNTSTLLQSGLEGSVHSEVQTGNHPAHHPPEAMEKRLIEWRKMWTCAEKVHWGDSNLHWQDISSSSLIHSQTLFMNQQYGSIQKKSQGSANEPKSTEATRSHWNIVRSPLVWFSLWSHHKWWSAKKARWTNATASSVKTSICEARQRPAKSGKMESITEIYNWPKCRGNLTVEFPIWTDTSTRKPLHLRLREYQRGGSRKTVRTRGPGGLLWEGSSTI